MRSPSPEVSKQGPDDHLLDNGEDSCSSIDWTKQSLSFFPTLRLCDYKLVERRNHIIFYPRELGTYRHLIDVFDFFVREESRPVIFVHVETSLHHFRLAPSLHLTESCLRL